MAASPRVRVWGRVQRLLHWALALSVLGALVLHEGGDAHLLLGYAALALAVGRVAAGLAGPRHWRFASFLHGPATTLAYARAVFRRTAPRHLNHNPLGAWMIVALLAAALLAGVSGALYNTDAYWGDPVVYTLHQIGGWAFAVLVPLHLGGVALSSWLHRENLVGAMIGGDKRAAGPQDRA